jgi:formamidopyrimidine-DNA glycosylase
VPELAEVEFYRKQWDSGLRQIVTRVALHKGKRLFRDAATERLAGRLAGRRLLGSEARAKQMLFRFSASGAKKPSLWLGIHLGMTGRLSVAPANLTPGKHDHLVLFQKRQALVLTDARMFGRVRLHEAAQQPDWWTALPPAVTSDDFTPALLADFCKRRARLAVKAALLVQTRFPGVGNWMADEILWQARIDPQQLCGKLSRARVESLWRAAREVCGIAMETVGIDFSDPPKGWLYHTRWSAAGHCPRDATQLKTATIGGRTTRWCAKCQR